MSCGRRTALHSCAEEVIAVVPLLIPLIFFAPYCSGPYFLQVDGLFQSDADLAPCVRCFRAPRTAFTTCHRTARADAGEKRTSTGIWGRESTMGCRSWSCNRPVQRLWEGEEGRRDIVVSSVFFTSRACCHKSVMCASCVASSISDALFGSLDPNSVSAGVAEEECQYTEYSDE